MDQQPKQGTQYSLYRRAAAQLVTHEVTLQKSVAEMMRVAGSADFPVPVHDRQSRQ